MRRRVLALFAGTLALALVVAGLALWRAGQGTDGLAQAVMLLGFGLTGLLTGLWFLFDQNVARPIETLAGALRTGGVPDQQQARYLADLGPAARDAALARQRSDQALALALDRHAAEIMREKASLESILADFGAGSWPMRAGGWCSTTPARRGCCPAWRWTAILGATCRRGR